MYIQTYSSNKKLKDGNHAFVKSISFNQISDSFFKEPEVSDEFLDRLKSIEKEMLSGKKFSFKDVNDLEKRYHH